MIPEGTVEYMNATSIVLLVGVVGLWGVFGLLIILFNRLRQTIDIMEATLVKVQSDLAELTPTISDALREIEKTGQEVGLTAAEVRILTRRVNSGTTPSFIGGAVGYLPAAMAVISLIKPFFSRRRRLQ